REGLPDGLIDLYPSPLDLAQVRQDHRYELAVFLQHADLTEDGMALVELLNVVGLDLLAALGDDQRRGAAADVQVAVGVEVPQVAGPEPAVLGEGFAGLVGQVAVAGEDVGTERENLSFLGLSLFHFLSFRRRDADLNAGERAADTADPRLARRVQRQHRGGFRESVAGADLPAKALQVPGQFGIERRSAGGEGTPLHAQLPVQRPQ